MDVLDTQLAIGGDAYAQSVAAMREKLTEIRTLEAAVRTNSEAKREKVEARGELLPRERVARLLDRGAPFMELSTLAGYRMHDDKGGDRTLGAGSIAGIGVVSGVRCLVLANDSAIKGGTICPMGLKKTLRAQALAMENRLPLIYLVQSGGANLNYQSELFVEGGRSFANQARLSAAGIPQIAVVHGSSTAGGAYLPGMSDYVVLVRGKSKIFLAGPPLVKAAIGEEASDEELGGAQLHAQTTGLGEYLAEDDAHAIELTRSLMASLHWDAAGESTGPAPRHDVEELLGVVPAAEKTPFDMREVIARIVDDSRFLEFKALFGAETLCGHACIAGHRIGIIGNNGPIQADGSVKAAQFIQLCDQASTPLLFLQNTTGYMVGTDAETAGAIKHGAKMIQAVANARVPRFTIVVRGSYGAGNYGMCGRGFDPSFIFSWPSARTAVMGGDQAAQVMEIISRAKFQQAGQPFDEKVLAQMSDVIRKQLDAESDVKFATARLWDDGVIDPRDTRDVLALCLQIAAESDRRTLSPNAFGVARM